MVRIHAALAVPHGAEEQPTSLQIAGATKNTYIKCLVREKAKDIS